MIDTFKKVVFENYANFNGRARRREYWMFVLANFVLSFIVSFVVDFTSAFGVDLSFLNIIYFLALFLPGLAVGVRRLHDTDRSGWMMLLCLIPLIGSIIVLVFECQEGTKGVNKYGPDPKGGATFKDNNSLIIED